MNIIFIHWHRYALEIAKREGGKLNLDIGQIKQVLRIAHEIQLEELGMNIARGKMKRKSKSKRGAQTLNDFFKVFEDRIRNEKVVNHSRRKR